MDRTDAREINLSRHVLCLHPSTELHEQLRKDWQHYPDISLHHFTQAASALHWVEQLSPQEDAVAVLLIADRLPDLVTSSFLQYFKNYSKNTQTLLLGQDLSLNELSLIINTTHLLHHFPNNASLTALHEKLHLGLLRHASLTHTHFTGTTSDTPIMGATAPKRILLVDDVPSNLMILKYYLDAGQYELLTAPSAAVAWEILQHQQPIHAVLLDVMMPGEDGFSLTQRIRQHWQLHQLPVLLISARGDVSTRVAGLEAGANDYLTKPVERRELLARLHTHLKLQHLQQDVAHHQHIEALLRQAKDTAESANQAKSVFLANMSHELRTPLNGILGYAQLLERDKGLQDKHYDAVQIIRRSGEHLLTLINDVLDLAKIEAGKLELHVAECHVSMLLNDIAELFRLRATQKRLTFITDWQPHGAEKGLPLVIMADEKRLRQILLNLLSNAVNYTQQGHIKLSVQRSANLLHFAVEDTGIGIEAEQLEQIFLPFQQLKNAHFHSEGTGLGLAITQVLVNMMGGQLQVRSRPGQGSVFHFSARFPMPTEAQDNEPEINAEQEITGYRSTLKDQSQLSIMVVDDRWENRALMQHLLSPLGFIMTEAQDGLDALEKARSLADQEQVPDVILMDLRMPGLDGMQCTRLLRADPRFDSTQIIAVSASVSPHIRFECQSSGCNDFVSKPIKNQLLLNTLERLCPLEWECDSQHVTNPRSPLAPSIDKMVLPEHSQLEYLLEVAETGDIRAIIEAATQLHEKAPDTSDFTRHIKTLAHKFETKKLKNLLRHHLEGD